MSESTFAAVLKRHGLVRPRRKRTKATPYTTPLDEASKPNSLWAIDFKGDFPVGRTRCYPLTITDSHSRFIIAIVALPNTRTKTVKRAMQRIFDEYGLPDAIRSDNGSPFSSRGVAGLSTLSPGAAAWRGSIGARCTMHVRAFAAGDQPELERLARAVSGCRRAVQAARRVARR